MAESLTIFCSTGGTILGAALTLTPVFAFTKANKSKSLAEISHLFLLMININAMVWLMFGLKSESVAMIIANGINAVITLFFVFWYHKISENMSTFMPLYLILIISVFYGIFLFLNIDLIGICCLIINIILYASPMEQLGKVIKEKDGKYIDMKIISVCLITCLMWGSFGILTSNPYVIIPNALGTLFNLFQIVVYLWSIDILPHWLFGKQVKSDYIKMKDF